MKKNLISLVLISIFCFSCSEIQNVVNNLPVETKPQPLTNEEVIKGLKEALKVGTDSAVARTSKIDGFYKNPLIFIPFPPEAEKMKNKLIELGFEEQVNKFVETLNRGAELAAKQAAPIFVDAIINMSIQDGFAILNGGENAATNFLREKTTDQLKAKFRPIIHDALQQVEITRYWNPLVETYNKIPFVEKMNPDLDAYVTDRAVSGLFLMIEQQEKAIRKDPKARVNDILKRVFGNS
ncbi:MAG: hypothetical protein KatS3mg034_0090 [Vicingaceae bacterium]|nr:MAG: hypothetical protein KatS3mg034_0090 [Vicingaceae bacterium]